MADDEVTHEMDDVNEAKHQTKKQKSSSEPETGADRWLQQKRKSDIDETKKIDETQKSNIDDDDAEDNDEVFTCDVCGEEGWDYYTRLRCHTGCGRRACHDCRSWTTKDGGRLMNDDEYFCAVCHNDT